MGYFSLGIYLILCLLGMLTIAKFISFLVKIMYEEKIALIRAPKINLVFLCTGLFMLFLFVFELYMMLVKYRHFELYLPLCFLFIGLSQITMFLDSKILVTQKGVYFSTIPFFISKSKIKTFTINNGKIFFEKVQKGDIVVLFDKAETEKFENALKTLLSQRDIQ